MITKYCPFHPTIIEEWLMKNLEDDVDPTRIVEIVGAHHTTNHLYGLVKSL